MNSGFRTSKIGNRITKTLTVGVGIVAIGGCSTLETKPLTPDDIRDRANTARIEARIGIPPISGELTLEEAIARAVKYNLSWRVRLMEEALSRNQLDVDQYDMLPKLVASAGYSARNNHHLTTAVDSVTGLPSLSNPFISNEKEHATTGLGLTWNTLDFGVSYYTARQSADRLLIATEKRRKALHTLIQDVNTAYWRAASAQALKSQIAEAIALAEDALERSRQEGAEQLRGAEESLRYQRQLLENLRLLEIINKELISAKVELAHLINAPVGAQLKLADVDFDIPDDILDLSVAQLEEMAIGNNAELRQKFYRTRIAAIEAKKTILKIFPRLKLDFNVKHDDDKYLVNNDWTQAGAFLSFNLFNLLSFESRQKLADAGVALSEQKMMSTLMAVIAKVHIARLDYIGTLRQFRRADEVWRVDDRLRQHTLNAVESQAQGELKLVAERTVAILSLLRRYQAYADTRAAAGRLRASLGMEPVINSIHDTSLSSLTGVIRTSLQQWQQAALPADTDDETVGVEQTAAARREN